MNIKQLATRALAVALIVIGMVSSAVPTSQPLVDLNIGPVAVNVQAVNVALALSVEFPTVGAAYRNGQYNHATEYLGYWDPKGCYDYKDTAIGAPLAGEYFYRTGNVDTDGYCNTTASGTLNSYSGNALNYVATSSIDLLRYALTGGDRVGDTTTFTILGRAYLRGGWLHSGNFPTKRIAAALEGLVTPDYPDSNTADVIAGSCDNKVVFGRNNTVKDCNNFGTSGSLNKTINTFSGTSTVFLPSPSTAPSSLSVFQFTTTTYSITSGTTSVAPTSGPIQTYTYITTGTGTATTPPLPTAVFGPTLTYFVSSSYEPATVSPTTTTVLPTAGPVVLLSSYTRTFAVRTFQSAVPSGFYRDFSIPAGNGTRVCKASADSYVGSLSAAGGMQDVGGSPLVCGTGAYSGFPNRIRLRDAPVSTLPATVYERYEVVNIYRVHRLVNTYKTADVNTAYYIYTPQNQDRWDTPVLSGTAPAPMFARVKVCEGAEATSRTELCLRYPDGNYKPVGEIQRRNEGMRVAAFGYVLDDTRARYGGVLRAPMRYTGPTFRDSAGAIQTNTAPEWDANNGVFRADPLSASPTFAMSGVVNYLNKFGSTGVYKTYDPVGELYYEALRYFQGLDPTPAATDGLTTAMYDKFPVYSTVSNGTGTFAGWTDPIENSCQRRNFILGIGDVNTHNDRQLPGHGGSSPASASTNAEDPARAEEPLLGDPSKVFNAVYWTQLLGAFETNTALSYVDAEGLTQSTVGNPNPVSGNSNLHTKSTGATNAAYYFAGAAYWANTQPIRLDTKSGKSMKDIRVKTFMVDVDEYGNGSIVNTRAFLLAGKYGWFNDANLDGNPYKTSGGVINNTEWQDPEEPLVPDGYVVASQAKRMIEGIRKFFAAATSEKGAVSVSSLSSQRYTTRSPNGDLFAPRFDTRDWSGTVQRSKLRLNTTTQSIESEAGMVWDAADLLTVGSVNPTSTSPNVVVTANRRIFTSNSSSNGSNLEGFEFKASERGKFDADAVTALDKNAAGVVDGNFEKRIDYLRGDRANEVNSSGGIFRRRNKVMGDIINSGPIYKDSADTSVSGDGYGVFARSVADRTATIYVGTNGGMLHGFRAVDGKEEFAYVPQAISKKLAYLTQPAYTKQAYVDAVPLVREAKTGSVWKTVLVSGMGGGAQGVFALDVTNPSAFDGSKVLFEFTDKNDSAVGNVVTQPKIIKLRKAGTQIFTWYVAFGSGYNNYADDGNQNTSGRQSLFLLSLDKLPGDAWAKDVNYYRIDLGTADASKADALANPGIYESTTGAAQFMYAGDLQGRLWRFNLSLGIDTANAAAAVNGGATPKPLFVATSPLGAPQPITTSPLVVEGIGSGLNVVFGTGKFVEPSDAQNAAVQAMYGVWDPLTDGGGVFSRTPSHLYQRTLSESTLTASLSGASSFTYAVSGSGTYRGWYFNLSQARERIAVEGAVGLGFIAINSTIPTGECSGEGSGREYAINPYFGTSLVPIRTNSSAGLLSRPNIIDVNYQNHSEDIDGYAKAATELISKRNSVGGRKVTITQQMLSTGTRLTDAGNAVVAGTGTSAAKVTITVDAGRMSWREIRNFND